MKIRARFRPALFLCWLLPIAIGAPTAAEETPCDPKASSPCATALTDARPWRQLDLPNDRYAAITVDPTGKLLAVSQPNGEIVVIDAHNGVIVHRLVGHKDVPRALCFSADGARLASGDDDGMLRVWGMDNGQALFSTQAHSDWVRACAFSSDGKRLASGGDDRRIVILDADTPDRVEKTIETSDWVYHLLFVDESVALLSADRSGEIRLHELASDAPRWSRSMNTELSALFSSLVWDTASDGSALLAVSPSILRLGLDGAEPTPLANTGETMDFRLTPTGEIPDDLVPIHALALAASEQIFFALSDLYAQDLETARKRIRRFDEVLKATSSWIDNKTPADAEHRQVASRLATDRATFSKFLALAENLGQPMAVSDAQQNAWGYLNYSLRQFGQVNSGFFLNTSFGY